MKTLVYLFPVMLFLSGVMSQDYPVDLNETRNYFDEIRKICDSDNGKLWGRSLWAPILIIDKNTRFIIANEPDNEGNLHKQGDVFIGYFPVNKNISNSTTHFGNKYWMMVMYPLPENTYQRNHLLIHELFHRLQDELKIGSGNYNNSHMDNMDARILIKLEWLALENAVNSKEKEKTGTFIKDALVFRKYRRLLYSGKDSMENKFEIHEGLADYTGHKLCSGSGEDLKSNILNDKNKYWKKETYVRTFGYYSGALYAYLLDRTGIDWRTNLKPNNDLGLLVEKAYEIEMPEVTEETYIKSRYNYNYDDIYVFEKERNDKRQEKLAGYRNKFLNDSVVILNLKQPNCSFNPSNLVPLDEYGTIYPTIRIVDVWGILVVKEEGCLLTSDFTRATITAKNIKQEPNKAEGDGWKLELNKNWSLERQKSNYIIKSFD
jgi:hypothetical protein